MRFPLRLRPFATLFTVAALGVLIGLGSWQLDRREWKLDLIATIEARLQAPPLGVIFPDQLDPEKLDLLEYRRTKVVGLPDYDKELYLHAIGPDGQPGVHVIVPVTQYTSTVLFDRGFVPIELKDPAKRAKGQIDKILQDGVIRNNQQPGLFTPPNEPQNNLWYYRDWQAMADAMGLDKSRVLPFIVEADATANPGGVPLGGQTRVEIKNDHLEYALTWFGLALTLLGVFLAFSWKKKD